MFRVKLFSIEKNINRQATILSKKKFEFSATIVIFDSF